MVDVHSVERGGERTLVSRDVEDSDRLLDDGQFVGRGVRDNAVNAVVGHEMDFHFGRGRGRPLLFLLLGPHLRLLHLLRRHRRGRFVRRLDAQQTL